MMHHESGRQMEGLIILRRMFSSPEDTVQVEEIIQSGVVERVVSFLAAANPALQVKIY